MIIDCYAQRLLDPFRGAMHTIRYDAAEAVTVDGLHWDIYVTNDALLTGLDHRAHAQVGDIHYGSWTAAEGMRRGRRRTGYDFRHMEAVGDVLSEHLAALHQHVPFGFQDNIELWLLDAAGQPLALLHSVLAEDEMRFDVTTTWHAGFAARERFTTGTLSDPGDDAPPNAGDYLTDYVNSRAGATPAAQWFRRESDGTGIGLAGIGMPHRYAGRRLDSDEFPALLLAEIGHDERHRCLIRDFHAWQAVWLLTLPALSPQARERLEPHVRRQAAIVEKQYRLYPMTIREDLITAARVEAVLRRSAQHPALTDDALSVFYIELNPCGGE